MSPTARRLDAQVSVSGQLRPEDLDGLRAAGVRLVVNNRPDGEEPGQPSGTEIEAAALGAGLAYAAIPISGRPSAADASAFAELLRAEPGMVHAYCRSGMRSTTCWAMAHVAAGTCTVDLVRDRALAAGYDLGSLPL